MSEQPKYIVAEQRHGNGNAVVMKLCDSMRCYHDYVWVKDSLTGSILVSKLNRAEVSHG